MGALANPYVLIAAVLVSVGYLAGEKVVDGAKKVEHAAVHGAKVAGSKIGHGAKKLIGK